ncbi:hypothetical protein JDV02_004242 [Purpureocillium takamizusanense]|uniref:Uncharacterized protein n=1 Tax=Purpureocillium takamizusanense TaxID=2060973 RepID=A0A9Q8QE13_9HYPO|nr:uncharacterized protein JDV02_004242 [Purpureocillium takamizusanense]UNI17935.1 hypothetical protein JDV02_004242 [Purpureocillium takamizusanense]
MLEDQLSEVQPPLKRQTASGLRRLPIDSFATAVVDAKTDRAVCEARFYAAGTGAYVGAARVESRMYYYDETEKKMLRFATLGRLARRNPIDQVERREVRELVLEPLWQLEREIWAERARVLAPESSEAKDGTA